MSTNATFAEVAAVAGDPARAAMMHALLDGRALTASELARVAGVTPPTASGHLGRLVEAGLLAVARQGRHRYYRLASPAVARMMESIMEVAAGRTPAGRPAAGPRDAALRKARTCYDHFAGELGVALADALVDRGHVEIDDDGAILNDSGLALLEAAGIDVAPLIARRTRRSGRILCRPCLDWSERRPHLAGMVGAAICAHALDHGWVRRRDGTRAVAITPEGYQVFRETFCVRKVL